MPRSAQLDQMVYEYEDRQQTEEAEVEDRPEASLGRDAVKVGWVQRSVSDVPNAGRGHEWHDDDK
jgi:hypothetical protein